MRLISIDSRTDDILTVEHLATTWEEALTTMYDACDHGGATVDSNRARKAKGTTRKRTEYDRNILEEYSNEIIGMN